MKNNRVQQTLSQYFKDNLSVKNGRHKSWEHCYLYFSKNKNSSDIKNVRKYMCMNLAFYLASWGMYRGSSFLLQKDYLVHEKAVKVILNKKYMPLWGCEISNLKMDSNIDLIDEAFEGIRKAYKGQGTKKNKNATDTLVTKIMLGTFGCVPAYDRYFKNGLEKNIGKKFSKKSLKSLVKFYNEHIGEFNKMYRGLKNTKVRYPVMKFIDMYFWQLGKKKKPSSR